MTCQITALNIADPELVVASDWFKTRPPAVQAMIRLFPPGSWFMDGSGKQFWVISYREWEDPAIPIRLQVSDIDPSMDYEKAVETRGDICEGCQGRLLEILERANSVSEY